MSLWISRVYRYGALAPTSGLDLIHEQFRRAARYRNKLVEIEREKRVKLRARPKEEHPVIRAAFLIEEKRARGECGLYSGTYQLVEEAMQESRTTTPLGKDPRFWRSDKAVVSAQIPGGIALHELEDDTQVQMHVADPERDLRYRVLKIRVGSIKKRKPIWAQVPLKLDRPLPMGCRIKRVTVRRVLGGARTANPLSGRRERWTVEFVIDEPLPIPSHGVGVVGVNVGWRRIDDELRVCTHASEDGRDIGELRLSAHLLGGFERVETLRSTRDKMRGPALDLLRSFRHTTENAWFLAETTHAHVWRSSRKLAQLVGRWRHNRFEGDEMIFAWLSHWLERDRHLWQWEKDQTENNLEARKKVFERYAVELACKYDTLVLDDYDLRKHAKRPDTDASRDEEGRRESHQAAKARSWRQKADVSKLRNVLHNAFLTRGGRICKLQAMTTRTCNTCGLVARDVDFAAAIVWTCECGAVHDQDVNAGDNLCERFRVAEKAGTARIDKAGKTKEEMGSRYSRARKKKAEKEAARKDAETTAE
jgi:hypothetical protein